MDQGTELGAARQVKYITGKNVTTARTRCSVNGALCFSANSGTRAARWFAAVFRLPVGTTLTGDIDIWGVTDELALTLRGNAELCEAVSRLLTSAKRVSLGNNQLSAILKGRKGSQDMGDPTSFDTAMLRLAQTLERLFPAGLNTESSLARLSVPFIAFMFAGLLGQLINAWALGDAALAESGALFGELGWSLLLYVAVCALLVMRLILWRQRLAALVVPSAVFFVLAGSCLVTVAGLPALDVILSRKFVPEQIVDVQDAYVTVRHSRRSSTCFLHSGAGPIQAFGQEWSALRVSCRHASAERQPGLYRLTLNPGYFRHGEFVDGVDVLSYDGTPQNWQ